MKIGDRVKAKTGNPKGYIGVIIELGDGPSVNWLVRFDDWADGHGKGDREWFMEEADLELVQDLKPLSFNVGDKIRIKKICRYRSIRGAEGVVIPYVPRMLDIADTDETIMVDLGGSNIGNFTKWYISPAELELVEPHPGYTTAPKTDYFALSGLASGSSFTSKFPEDAKERKKHPVASGVIDYFPDALIAVSKVSFIGNEQHNPGTPLHWDRSKSTDEADALLRHFIERGKLDKDGIRHSAKMAWRALALLQKEIEGEKK